jgi:hypothetical protein
MTDARLTQGSVETLGADSPGARVTQGAVEVLGTPSPDVRMSTGGAEALGGGLPLARMTQGAVEVLAAYIPLRRQRAWTFTLDGHTFYVLDLGEQGTFAYDVTARTWSQFQTVPNVQWNVINGVMWGNRIVGGDLGTSDVWEAKAEALMDHDDVTLIEHLATGGVQTRSRSKVSVSAFRVTGAVGQIGAVSGTATMSLRWSDDNGKTFSPYFSVTLTEGSHSKEVAYRSLGAFAAPGRVFELSDMGGPLRIDGADADVDGEVE